ncbi:MAG: nucleotide sugar dehydrogenase [Anaerolineae bacterium]
MPSIKEYLLSKIADGTTRVAIIGLGYVGLPLAVEFARGGLSVTGIDLNPSKCAQVNAGQSYIGDVASEVVADLVRSGKLCATTDFSALDQADAAIICVPTPLGKTKDPDISFIIAAADSLAAHIHAGMLVVLESTTYPGTTEELLLPRIAGNGYTVGVDFFLAFSPERVDPGNRTWHTRNTPKILGGQTPACLEVAQALYHVAVDTLVPVSSPATAEMVKILENTFRAVNIGLANEMAQICNALGLDVWEVIAAARTKPYGYMPFYPGPGLGGHCIPIDPLYLTWKMRGLGMQTRFIELADTINSAMPHWWVSRVQDALNEVGKPIKGSRILILGVAYKADIDDLRESPALTIISELLARGADIVYNDPHVPSLRLDGAGTLNSQPLEADLLLQADCVLVHTAHSVYDWTWIAQHARLVVDTRNAIPKSLISRI